MSRRLVLIALLAVLGAQVMRAAAAPPAQACSPVGLGADAQASSCGQLGWSYDPTSKRFGFGSQVTASDDSAGSKFVYSLVSACDRSRNAGDQNLCANTGNCPPRVGPDGAQLRVGRFQGLRAPTGPDGRRHGPLQPYGAAICVYQGRSVPMAAVVAAVRDRLTKQVGRPTATVQPSTRGLIHWPMLFSAPPEHTTTLAITRPLRGAITAVPHYTWDLGDGQQGVGAGHSYTDGLDPRSPSTNGYYVKATYQTPGTHRVTLTLTWTAAIHLGPAGAGLDVTLDPITFTATATATVVSATNRLYSQVPP